jgi:hypothetical protein
MGMEFYGDSYKGNDEPIFVGIPTFLKLPWIKTLEELKKVKPDIAIIGELFVQEQDTVQELLEQPQQYLLHPMNTSILKQVWIHLEFFELLITVM